MGIAAGGAAWHMAGVAAFVVLALLSVFVHRLAALVLVAAGCAALAYYSDRRHLALRVGLGGVLLAVSAAIVREMQRGLGGDFATIAEAGAYIPAGPPFALWLTLLRFSFDRGPGEFASWWLLPWLALSVGGGLWLLRDSLRPTSNGGGAARALACFGLVPLVLFLAQLATTRLYEARYLIIVYPAWLLLLAYPLTALPRLPRIAHSAVIAGALLVCLVALAQPPRGLFSGYPVKEQYREAVRVLAERVHPDDLIVLHPSYIEPLYDYYMQRFSADPAPQPVLFEAFKHRQTAFNQRDWDEARRRYFAGYVRSFLLIAPNHARTVDRPPTAVDEYGLVGLYYQYSREQQKWPCGIWRFNGAHLLCQDSPEAYETGTIPEPATPIRATFGETIAFFGYTLKATTPTAPAPTAQAAPCPLRSSGMYTRRPLLITASFCISARTAPFHPLPAKTRRQWMATCPPAHGFRATSCTMSAALRCPPTCRRDSISCWLVCTTLATPPPQPACRSPQRIRLIPIACSSAPLKLWQQRSSSHTFPHAIYSHQQGWLCIMRVNTLSNIGSRRRGCGNDPTRHRHF
ncbi:MAG: DUF2339 domain-containing protein [Chloroflexaceae bacterium]|nr:DUF2339 domain-containing protein [Chloroflexaceae bacterium]